MDSSASHNSFPRMLPSVVLVTACVVAAYFIILRPAYFSTSEYLGILIMLQGLLAAVWNYRTAFLFALMGVFFWAGMDIPLGGTWTAGRWLVLAIGALAGIVVYTKNHRYGFALFHGVAGACVFSALASSYSSAYPGLVSLKAVSVLLLFLYGAFGARAAVKGRETQFFSGILLACELLVYGTAAAYFIFRTEIFGNPNSLGAVMGVVAVPSMLWGVLVSDNRPLRRRRALALGLSLLLLFSSYARAGIVAAGISCAFLCVGLHRYRVLTKVVAASLALAALAAALGPRSSQHAESLTSTFLYKGHREEGILGSRRSVWDQTLSVIREHPWFGSGFGTSVVMFEYPVESGEAFKSAPETTREHGSSYLAIVEGTGIVGALPFLILVMLTVINIVRVIVWMRRSRDPCFPCILLAAVLAAGLSNAAFEDWLFAPGYYLCVLFWVFAFILIDFLPATAPLGSPHSYVAAQIWPASQGLVAPAP
jgi:O-antigen ligase